MNFQGFYLDENLIFPTTVIILERSVLINLRRISPLHNDLASQFTNLHFNIHVESLLSCSIPQTIRNILPTRRRGQCYRSQQCRTFPTLSILYSGDLYGVWYTLVETLIIG